MIKNREAKDNILNIVSDNIGRTRPRIAGASGLSPWKVSQSLRELRKEGIVILYYRKYWGLKKSKGDMFEGLPGQDPP